MLSPKVRPGLSFVTDGLGKAFLPTPKTFPDDQGFCVVTSRGGRDVYELQDSDVVCLRSAPTDANGYHSLIPTSGGGAHALPPFATVTLEKVMQPGEWEVCGQHVKRRLLMVGVTLSDDAAQKPSNRRAIYAGVAQLSPRGPAELSYAELPAAPLDLPSESASEIVSKIVPRDKCRGIVDQARTGMCLLADRARMFVLACSAGLYGAPALSPRLSLSLSLSHSLSFSRSDSLSLSLSLTHTHK